MSASSQDYALRVVAYDGVSILEIEGGKVHRFMAYFDTRDLTLQVVD